jgi:hypothetical protein
MRIFALTALLSLAVALPDCSDSTSGSATDVGAHLDEMSPPDAEDSLTLEDTAPEDGQADSDTPSLDHWSMDTSSPQTGPGPFAEGCPAPGLSTARIIATEEGFEGHAAIGTTGDYLLMNEQAAFIIEAEERANAYYYFGGILVDAVALEGCDQAGPEQFEELGLMMVTLSLDIYSSSLRAFRATSVEVLADGSDGGPAIVRAIGADDRFWIGELEMIAESYQAGNETSLSEPFNLEVVVDYILYPDSPVLRIEATYRNLGSEELPLFIGSEAQFAQTFQPRYLAWETFAFGEWEFQTGAPWMVASNGHGATALATDDGDLAILGVAGVTILFDLLQLEKDMSIAPAGEPGDSRTTTTYISVGATDANSATAPLHAVNPEPIPGLPYELVPISGEVVEEGSGLPLAGVVVSLGGENSDGQLQPLDSFVTDEEGFFGGWLADFGPEMPLVFVLDIPGRPGTQPVPVDTSSLEPVLLTVPPGGQLTYLVLDQDGKKIPAKLELRQNGSLKRRIWSGNEERTVDAVPGSFEMSVTRGYEYATHSETIDVKTGQATAVEVTLERVLDTTGYLSVDTHLHAAPSSDSDIAVPHRLVTVAGEGLEIAVATDHEVISDWSWAIPEAGLEGFVNTIIGQEVTCTLPEHINMFPVEPWFHIDARGGIPRWYGKDIDEVFEMLWDRGAQVVCLNHPRGGSGYLTLIDYNSVTGEPTLTDPTLLAWPEDASLWSWNFNAIELMNDPDYIYRKASKPHKTGLFDDWMGFHNLGHRVTAVGSSDTHGISHPGRPRTYVESPTDEPSEMVPQQIAEAIDQGRATISAGAFMRVEVDGEAGPGETITPGDDVVDLWIHIESIPAIDVAWVKVYANCDQVATIATTSPDEVVKLDTKFPLKLTVDSHIVVAAFGQDSIPAALGNYDPEGAPRAISNPIFVDIDNNGVFDPPGAKSCSYDLDGPLE